MGTCSRGNVSRRFVLFSSIIAFVTSFVAYLMYMGDIDIFLTRKPSVLSGQKNWEYDTHGFKLIKDKLRKAVTYGNVKIVKKILTDTCGMNYDNSQTQHENQQCMREIIDTKPPTSTSLLDLLLQQQFSVISHGLPSTMQQQQDKEKMYLIEKQIIQNYDKIFDIVLPYSDMTSCPIVLAIHYRLYPFVEKMIETKGVMKPDTVQNCFEEIDIYGEHVLHIVSKSKASGFARYFIRTKNHHNNSSKLCVDNNSHCNFLFNDRLLLKNPVSLIPQSSLLSEKKSETAGSDRNNNYYTFSQLDDATGVLDLSKLLAYGFDLPKLNHKKWLNSENINGETPLLM